MAGLAAAGAAIGSVVPVIGTAAGAAVGGLLAPGAAVSWATFSAPRSESGLRPNVPPLANRTEQAKEVALLGREPSKALASAGSAVGELAAGGLGSLGEISAISSASRLASGLSPIRPHWPTGPTRSRR